MFKANRTFAWALLLGIGIAPGKIAYADTISYIVRFIIGPNYALGNSFDVNGYIALGQPVGGSYPIIGMTTSDTWFVGGIGPRGITGVLAPNSYLGNDNLFFGGNAPSLDYNGVSFATNDGAQFNLYFLSPTNSYFVCCPNSSVTFDLRDTVPPAPVPEPSTLVLLGLGLVGLAGAVRRRTHRARDMHQDRAGVAFSRRYS